MKPDNQMKCPECGSDQKNKYHSFENMMREKGSTLYRNGVLISAGISHKDTTLVLFIKSGTVKLTHSSYVSDVKSRVLPNILEMVEFNIFDIFPLLKEKSHSEYYYAEFDSKEQSK